MKRTRVYTANRNYITAEDSKMAVRDEAFRKKFNDREIPNDIVRAKFRSFNAAAKV